MLGLLTWTNMETIALDIIVKCFLGGLCGYFFWKLRSIETRLLTTMSETQVKEIIDLKGEKALILNKELKEDVRRLEQKLDRLIDLSLSHK